MTTNRPKSSGSTLSSPLVSATPTLATIKQARLKKLTCKWGVLESGSVPHFGVAGDVAEEAEEADPHGHPRRREQRVHLRRRKKGISWKSEVRGRGVEWIVGLGSG